METAAAMSVCNLAGVDSWGSTDSLIKRMPLKFFMLIKNCVNQKN